MNHPTKGTGRQMAAKVTAQEAEAIRSGYLPASAVGKVSPAMREYHGMPAETGVVRDTSGAILRGPSLLCGCPLDADCNGWHALTD